MPCLYEDALSSKVEEPKPPPLPQRNPFFQSQSALAAGRPREIDIIGHGRRRGRVGGGSNRKKEEKAQYCVSLLPRQTALTERASEASHDRHGRQPYALHDKRPSFPHSAVNTRKSNNN